jgi:anti-anti-sigma factor
LTGAAPEADSGRIKSGYTWFVSNRRVSEDNFMQASVTVTEGRAVILLQGRFDFNSHRDFREAVDTALASPGSTITVNLAGVEYLDSSALGMLLMLRDRAKGAAREVALTGCRSAVKQILDIANFGKLFSMD